jgi:hypothetical protein
LAGALGPWLAGALAALFGAAGLSAADRTAAMAAKATINMVFFIIDLLVSRTSIDHLPGYIHR